MKIFSKWGEKANTWNFRKTRLSSSIREPMSAEMLWVEHFRNGVREDGRVGVAEFFSRKISVTSFCKKRSLSLD